MSGIFSRNIWILAMLLLGAISPTLAQIPQLGQEKADSIPAPQKTETKVIPVPEISLRSLETKINLKEYRGKLFSENTLLREAQKIEKLLASFKELKSSPRLSHLEQINSRSLENIRREASLNRSKIENEKAQLIEKVEVLESVRKQLFADQTLWQNTLESIQTGSVPASTRPRIREILSEIDSITLQLNNQTEYFLELLDQVTDALLFIQDLQSRIALALLGQQETAFHFGEKAIWEVSKDSLPQQDLQESLSQFLKDSRRHFLNFYESNEKKIIIYLLCSVLLLLYLLFLSRQQAALPKEDATASSSSDDGRKRDAQHAPSLFSKPLATTLLISLLGTYAVFSQAPLLITDLISLMLIPTLLVLVPAYLPLYLKRPLYLLALAYFLIKIHGLNTGFPLMDRIFILTTNLIVIWIDYRILDRRGKLKGLEHPRFFKLVKWVAIITLVVSILSTIANLFGGIYISELLTTALVKSVFNGVLLYIGGIVLINLWALALKSRLLRQLKIVQKREKQILQKTTSWIWNLAIFSWILATLRVFNLLPQISQWLNSLLEKNIQVGSLDLSLGKILAFLITIWLSIVVARLIRAILEDEVYERVNLPRGLPATISMMVRYSVITIGFFVAAAAAGLSLDNLAIIFGAFSVGIGFGLQNIFNNLVSGLILAFERPVQVGDVIEVGSLLGVVRSMGIRSSKVRTFDGAEVIVPNGHLISNEVVNWTHSDQLRRVKVNVGVAYGTDVKTVQEILGKAAREHPDVEGHPPPLPLFTGFGDSSLDFQLLFWTGRFDDFLRIQSEVARNVSYALIEAGITIPFPQRDVHVIPPKEEKEPED